MRYLHTMLRVRNLDAALDFYCNKFGLKEVRRRDDEWPPDDAATSGEEHLAFGVPVRSAGLVLLAPFLVRLFEACRIARAATPRIAAEDLPRACALLHHAATGQQKGQEFELGFIKVLLGLCHVMGDNCFRMMKRHYLKTLGFQPFEQPKNPPSIRESRLQAGRVQPRRLHPVSN